MTIGRSALAAVHNIESEITILGCGVSGLTTGIVLREAGYDAHIVTAAWPAATVSAKAAAIWFPFQMGPAAKANLWSKITYAKFAALAMDPATGIHMRRVTELIADEADAWWKDALPEDAIRQAEAAELPAGFSLGYVMQVPVIETPIYLQWLVARFQGLGGKISEQQVTDLGEFAALRRLTVNCTGLEARRIVQDDALLYAIRGQIVKIAADASIESMSADMQLWGSATDLAYIIPRSDCIVLGGNAQPGNEDMTIDADETQGIIDRCARLDPRIAHLPILNVEVGLRPGRKEIRLARQGNIIHNYGHGGGGYTVSWGCAWEVLDLVMDHLKDKFAI